MPSSPTRWGLMGAALGGFSLTGSSFEHSCWPSEGREDPCTGQASCVGESLLTPEGASGRGQATAAGPGLSCLGRF